MKIYIYIAFTILSGLHSNIASAQPGPNLINGKVISFEESLPIKGATVTIKGTNKFTVTGADGSFKLSVSPEDRIIIITHPEYETAEVNITGKASYQVVLKMAGSHALNLEGSIVPLSLKYPTANPYCR